MTRVLYVITELDIGGAERALCELARRLDRQRFTPQVACLTGEGPLVEPLRESGVPVHLLGACCKADLRALWRLRQLLREADVAHSFLFHANLLTRLAAIGTSARAVISSARVTEPDRPHRRTLDRLTHRLVNAEVCVSSGVRNWLIEGGLPAEKLVVIPNGVDVKRFAGRDPAFKSELGIAPEAPLVTTVGRLTEQKGIEGFIEAATTARHAAPKAHFLIVGEGPLRPRLEAQAEELGLGSAITFLGFRSDVPDILRATDLFVLASHWEGMPNALLEAMAACAPAIGTRVEGTVDVIKDGETGLLVAPRDPRALAEAMKALLTDRDRAAALGRAAREHVETHFSLDTMVRRHEDLYERLLAGNVPSSRSAAPHEHLS
jgi:glycosyltransferase involved in cell wall biosynthesis